MMKIDYIGLIKQNTIYKTVRRWQWKAKGQPIPPPHCIKEDLICEMQKKYNIEVLIETGTFMGDMIFAILNKFIEIHSIELAECYYQKAKLRFSQYKKVNLHLGDSAHILPTLLPTINSKPIIFWLDGHYCGPTTGRATTDTPILTELNVIAKYANPKSIVLIDDSRHFTGTNGYPTIEYVEEIAKTNWPNHIFKNMHDSIRIFPKNYLEKDKA
jgi:hypothetical protein